MEIKKLADIIEWADGWIEGMKDGMTEEEFAVDKEVKAFEDVKKVILESMERHSVYTNALNADIVAKDAKIDLLEKEIEGRKEGYTALKERMDTKYISIEEHNSICKEYEDKIRSITKSRDTWFDTAGGHSTTIIEQSNTIKALEEKVKRQKENLDGINKTLEIKTKENESLITVKKNQDKEIEAHESENARLTEKIVELKKQNEYLTKELNESYNAWDTDSKNHSKRDMTLVDELGKKNDEIKKLKEENSRYWEDAFKAVNQERIRTDQLRATESKVEELYKEIKELKDENSYLKKESKNKSEMLRKAYVRYVDEACKDREEIMNECYEKLTKDDTGYTGFKQYTLRALEAQEGDEKKTKEFLCDSAEIIFYNKRAEEKRKEEAKKELNEAFGVPCGSDAIE